MDALSFKTNHSKHNGNTPGPECVVSVQDNIILGFHFVVEQKANCINRCCYTCNGPLNGVAGPWQHF
jgi:hypothetical protein